MLPGDLRDWQEELSAQMNTGPRTIAELLESDPLPVPERPADRQRKAVKLTIRQAELLFCVLDDCRADCDRRMQRKDFNSPEYTALSRLTDDLEAVSAKISALFPVGSD